MEIWYWKLGTNNQFPSTYGWFGIGTENPETMLHVQNLNDELKACYC